MSKNFTKPLPYILQRDSYPVMAIAKRLRETFAPIIKRRLPTVYYSGWSANFIPNFVKNHKHSHPYFLKIDIQKFYPSLSHHHLLVEGQMAYKKLHSLSYVPKRFKDIYIAGLLRFFSELSLQKVGIPLNSGMSKTIAPLIYIPFF